MKIKNTLSVLVLITATLFNNNLDAACNTKDGEVKNISIELPPVVRINESETYTLIGDDLDISDVTVEWTVDGEVVSEKSTTLTHAFTSKGDKIITAEITDPGTTFIITWGDFECVATATASVKDVQTEDGSNEYEYTEVEVTYSAQEMVDKIDNEVGNLKANNTLLKSELKKATREYLKNSSSEFESIENEDGETITVSVDNVDSYIDSNFDPTFSDDATEGISAYNDAVRPHILTAVNNFKNKVKQTNPKIKVTGMYKYYEENREPGAPGWEDITGSVSGFNNISVTFGVSYTWAVTVGIGVEVTAENSVGFEGSISGAIDLERVDMTSSSKSPSVKVKAVSKLSLDGDVRLEGQTAGLSIAVGAGLTYSDISLPDQSGDLIADGQVN